MAEQQLNIRLNAIDNASRAFTQVKNSVFNLRNALIGLGAGLVTKSLIDIGKKAEEAKLRLSNLTGSTEAGARAFEQFTQFAIASKIPLENVISSSKKLIALGSSPEKLAKNLKQVSNISATLGLDFETSVEQFSKATTKGLSNARIFAEANLKQILGIPKGLELSAGETARLFEREFSGSGRFAKAGDNLRNSLTGNIIAIQNVFFKFASDVGNKFFNVLKNQIGDLGQFFKNNQEPIKKFAELIGTGLANIVTGTANAIKLLKDNIEILLGILIGTAIVKSIDLVKQLTVALISVATVFKTNPVWFTIGATITGIATAFALLENKTKEAELVLKKIEQTAVKTKKTFDSSIFGDESREVLQNTNEGLYEQKIRLEEISALEKGLAITRSKAFEAEDFAADRTESYSGLSDILEKVKDKNSDILDQLLDVGTTVSNTLNKGISDFSQGLAESIILGKSLSDTFRNLGQNLLVAILKNSIEIVARKTLELALERLITQEKITQSAIQKGSAISSVLSFGSNILGKIGLAIGGMRGSPFAEGGQVQAGMPYTVGERGRELFVPQTDGKVIPNHDLGGGTILNFNINATDVRGVRELLLNNRATITNIVNQALNAKGKSNLVWVEYFLQHRQQEM